MDDKTKDLLIGWAEKYNDPRYFTEDPIIFPKKMAEKYACGECRIADVEIAAIIAARDTLYTASLWLTWAGKAARAFAVKSGKSGIKATNSS